MLVFELRKIVPAKMLVPGLSKMSDGWSKSLPVLPVPKPQVLASGASMAGGQGRAKVCPQTVAPMAF